MSAQRVLGWIAAGVAAAAGLVQIALLLHIFFSRLTYPYDLEWMEGGMLCHALRLMQGKPLYGPPSAEFISYLYTPLYPVVLAGLGQVFGLSYALGRLISVVSFLGVLALVVRAVQREGRGALGLLWGLAAAGLCAASFQHTGAWYDLVRNDSLYLLLVTAGLYVLRYHHRRYRWLVLASVLLGLSFLAKQTASLFIVYSGLALLALSWRRLPLHVALVGLVAGGTVLLWNHLSDGWFWRYTFQMHQGHDLYRDRIWPGTELKLLGFFPAAAYGIGLWLLVATGAGIGGLVKWARARGEAPPMDAPTSEERQDRGSLSLLFWLGLALTGVAVSAVGFATQWASHNAYIPGLVFPSIFVGMAGADLARRFRGGWTRWLGGALSLVLSAGLSWQLVHGLYRPKGHIPDDTDRKRGANLIAQLRRIDGPVMMPYHPYYPVLAGKPAGYAQMGINDVTRAGHAFPQDLIRRVAHRHYGAIVLDNPPRGRYDFIFDEYKLERYLPWTEVPRVVTGYPVRPTYLFVPKQPDPVPPDGRRVFGFEDGGFDGWAVEGQAFGKGPVGGPVWDQGPVGPFEGSLLVSSYHGGDAARGSMVSPEFVLDRPVLTYRVGGGRRPADLQVRVVIQGQAVHSGSGPGSDIMIQRRVDLKAHVGQTARVELVDHAVGPWGHIMFDDLTLLAR